MTAFTALPLHDVFLSGRRNHEIIHLLIPPRRILLIILRHPHHLRYRHSINLAERILNRTLRQLPIPLILHLRNLPRRTIIKDINFTINSLLLINPLYNIASPQIHGDGVAAGSDFVVQSLDLGECGLQTVPLRFVLLTADGFGDGVFKGAVVGPELEFFEGGAACEEVKDAAYEGFLSLVERDAAGRFYVGVFDVEVVWC